MRTLRDMDALLDAKTLGHLGDPILYTPAPVDGIAQAPLALVGFYDAGQVVAAGGTTGVVTGDRSVELPVADVPVKPGKGCIINAGDLDQEPLSSLLDETGRWWIVKLKKLPS